jgi:hypothetical protein
MTFDDLYFATIAFDDILECMGNVGPLQVYKTKDLVYFVAGDTVYGWVEYGSAEDELVFNSLIEGDDNE